MKNIIILFLIILIGQPCLAYAGYYGYYSSYGSAVSTSKYTSASSSIDRYHSSQMQGTYNSYDNRRGEIYCTSVKGNGYSSKPLNNSYGFSENVPNRSYINNRRAVQRTAEVPVPSLDNEMKPTSFRYNTLDYKKVRKMDADPTKEYGLRCTDIGGVSFCQ